ncbi:hypothetical protein DAI22_03g297101 [Oryza sativa Japonica Group]|nr:hypothetical protein DAI22_03g297101 [Oryza sativa Japonica Group]
MGSIRRKTPRTTKETGGKKFNVLWDINQLSENQRELTSRLCRMSEASSRARSTR